MHRDASKESVKGREERTNPTDWQDKIDFLVATTLFRKDLEKSTKKDNLGALPFFLLVTKTLELGISIFSRFISLHYPKLPEVFKF